MSSTKMANSYLHFIPAAVFILLPATFIVTSIVHYLARVVDPNGPQLILLCFGMSVLAKLLPSVYAFGTKEFRTSYATGKKNLVPTLERQFQPRYLWSVKEDHVYPILPNISETGALPPESCLFGMMLNLTAFTMLFTIYVRHKEIVEVFRAKHIEKTIPQAFIVNRVSTITGVVACGSLDVTANFQEVSEMAWVHRIAAAICFYSSALYLVQQAVLTAWMVPEISGVWLVHVRWFLGGVAVITVLSETVTTTTSFALLAVNGNLTRKINMPGYSWHCASSALQWITVSALGTYILTLYWDFKKISIFEPELEIAEDPAPEPVQPKGFRRAISVQE